MLPSDPPPRMKPLRPDEFSEETKEFFAKWSGGFFKDADKNPPLMTFAHHPQLAALFSQFNIHLLTTSTLPVKQRQIAIMRTAWVCGATYMWSSHLNTSQLLGLPPDMFGPLQVGADDPYFTPFERLIILATEELVRDRQLSEASWAGLMAEWNNQQMLDFLFTVGCYVMVAGVMRATGVQRNPDLLELAAQYGAPPAS
jgi:4-carboxymuconolactone decarboxylase